MTIIEEPTEEQLLEYGRRARERSRLKLETQAKEHVENELLDLLTDPSETRIDVLMKAQAMHAGLVRYTDPLDKEVRIELRKARKLLRHASKNKE